MNVAVHNHQNKGARLIEALVGQGHRVNQPDPDLLLIDHDGTDYYREILDRAQKSEIPAWVYSHGAMSCMAWDGWFEPHPHVSGYLATGEGQREVMEAYGYPNDVRVIGWYWCDKGAYRTTVPRRVLFAPVHPLNNGFMRPSMYEANKKAFELLLDMPVQLTVRHIGDLEMQGLWEAEGVRYVRGVADNSTADIDRADVVVSWGTYAHMAVAKGCPTVMFGQDAPPENGHSEDDLVEAESWDKYRDILRYPLELFDGDAWGVVQDAASGNYRPLEWERKFIGNAMQPGAFVRLLQDLLQESENGKI